MFVVTGGLFMKRLSLVVERGVLTITDFGPFWTELLFGTDLEGKIERKKEKRKEKKTFLLTGDCWSPCRAARRTLCTSSKVTRTLPVNLQEQF